MAKISKMIVTVPAGSLYADFNHGLSSVPDASAFAVTPITDLGRIWWSIPSDEIDASTARLSLNGELLVDADFAVQVLYELTNEEAEFGVKMFNVTIPAGELYVDYPHGLTSTPNAEDFAVTPQSALDGIQWCLPSDEINASTFRVQIDGALFNDVTFSVQLFTDTPESSIGVKTLSVTLPSESLSVAYSTSLHVISDASAYSVTPQSDLSGFTYRLLAPDYPNEFSVTTSGVLLIDASFSIQVYFNKEVNDRMSSPSEGLNASLSLSGTVLGLLDEVTLDVQMDVKEWVPMGSVATTECLDGVTKYKVTAKHAYGDNVFLNHLINKTVLTGTIFPRGGTTPTIVGSLRCTTEKLSGMKRESADPVMEDLTFIMYNVTHA